MRILIAGGGIGGAATAVALRRVGIDSLVLEQAPVLEEVGAGVSISPNAGRALDHLGAGAAVRERAVFPETLTHLDIATNEVLFQTRFDPNIPMLLVHRADLLDALLAQLPAEQIRVGSRVVAVENGERGVRVTLASGEELFGDALIGADGLHSVVQAAILGEIEPEFTGYVGWRSVWDSSRTPHLLSLNHLWAGNGRHVVFYPLRGGSLLNLVAYVPQGEIHRESWSLSGDVADLRASFADACEAVREVINSTEEAFLTAIYFRYPLKSWTQGRVALLGDAAHSVLPTAGQGAAMALEDAVTLAACLKRNDSEDVEKALVEYEIRRHRRTSHTQILSRNNLNSWHETNPIQIQARNGRFRGLTRLDPRGEVHWAWLWNHDPVAAAEKPLEEIQDEAKIENPLIRSEARTAYEQWVGAVTDEENARGWLGQRVGYSRLFAPSTSGTAVDCNGVPGLTVGEGRSAILLHFHGGGFVLGSAASSLDLAGRIANVINGTAIVPDYRLAPEAPFPAAVDDARAAFEWVTGKYAGTPVVVSGADAGATLALSVATSPPRGCPAPVALFLASPFLDLSLKAPSISGNAGRDPWYDRTSLTLFAASYIQEADPLDPAVSPIYADLSNLPPTFVTAAANEALRDDAVRLVADACAAGANAVLRLVDDTVPSFVLFKSLPEASAVVDDFGGFVRTALRESDHSKAAN